MVLNRRLYEHIGAWRHIQAPVTVQQWIQDGIRIPFLDDHEPDSFFIPQYKLTKQEDQFVQAELKELQSIGAIKQVDQQPWCVSPLKCAPKKGGTYRLITDLRHLNASVSAPTFQNENINTVARVIQAGDSMATFDLKNGFFHVPVHPDHQQFLGFQFHRNWYVWKVLPFGLSASPYFFHKVLRPVVSYLRQQGIRLVLYVDDCLILAPTECAADHCDRVVQTFLDLGFIINYEKSDLVPGTRKEFIGYIIDSLGPDDSPWVYISDKKIKKLKKDIRRVLDVGCIHARLLAKIAGQAVAMSKAIRPGKLKLRSLYVLLSTKNSWTDRLVITQEAASDLTWWLQSIDEWNGSPLQVPPVDIQIWTDACNTGWGCVCQDLEASGAWSEDIVYTHINYKELLAVLMALKSFAPHLEGKSVQFLCDSVTAVAYLNNLGGPSVALTDLAERIWATALANRITLSARHLAGTLNDWADRLSRLPVQYEWKLNPVLFDMLDHMWGPHTIDRFASFSTTQLPQYNSRFLDPATSGIDALAQTDWHQENNYVNPPFRMLDQVLNVVESQQAFATVLAPLWPSQPWFRRLTSLLVAPPIRIPNCPQAMLRMGDLAEPLKNRKWKLFAWRIFGGLSCRP